MFKDHQMCQWNLSRIPVQMFSLTCPTLMSITVIFWSSVLKQLLLWFNGTLIKLNWTEYFPLFYLLYLHFHTILLSRDTGDILLKICNLMPQDTGIYTCVAVNSHGTSSSSASIKVQGDTLGYNPDQYLRGLLLILGWQFLSLLAGIPGAPRRPVAQEASSKVVMIHWLPPASSMHCAVSSYTVEYRQEGLCVGNWN